MIKMIKWIWGSAFFLVMTLPAGLAFADHYTGEMNFLNTLVIVRVVVCFEETDPETTYRCEVLFDVKTKTFYIALWREKNKTLFSVWKENGEGWTLIYPALPKEAMRFRGFLQQKNISFQQAVFGSYPEAA